jgi:hypothetical protein
VDLNRTILPPETLKKKTLDEITEEYGNRLTIVGEQSKRRVCNTYQLITQYSLKIGNLKL